jgi:hypothetical protein
MVPLGHLYIRVQMRLDGIRCLQYQSGPQILLSSTMRARGVTPPSTIISVMLEMEFLENYLELPFQRLT